MNVAIVVFHTSRSTAVFIVKPVVFESLELKMKNMNTSKLALAIAAIAIAGAAGAADSNTGTLAVSATVAAECAVAETAPLAFANLAMLNIATATQNVADSIAAGTVNAICTNGTTLPKFKYASANVLTGAFRLKGGTVATDFIAYTVHQDSTATLAAVAHSTLIAHPDFSADGTTKSLNLSAKIVPAEKNGKSVQAYTDTITITTSFGV
jgi:spore coat protein U-like protein